MAAPQGSFMVPAGRRLSRVDSKTLRESFSGEASAEMEAVMRNLSRKDDKIKYNRRMRAVLASAVGVMVIMVGAMFAVSISANEATKESHITATNQMVGLDGKAVTTAKDTSYIKLTELSRASLEYLSNLEDVTLASQGKVFQYQIAGYTLHDTDNLDLHTSLDTTIQIQCGAVHIKTPEGKLIDADEMNSEAAGAARQLRAMSAAELQAHYEEHASVTTRKLAAKNPLKALSAFFGGMAKSSANSELYGALAPTTGCKKPAAIISFARPTIPADSKWTVQDAKTKEVQTWYMKMGDDSEVPVMRFEQKIGECSKSVVVGTADTSATWTEYDSAMCKEAVQCPGAEELKALKTTCDEFKTEVTKGKSARQGERTGCSHSTGQQNAGTLEVKILDVKTDGSAVWEIGIWAMEVSATGTPTGIRSKYQENAAFDKVLSVEEQTDAKVFDVCKVGDDGLAEGGKRQLSAWTWFQAKVSGTNWCGAGSDIMSLPCPINNADAACREHDHGVRTASVGLGVRLECAVDKNLYNKRDGNWAIAAAFGPYGLAYTWGCYDRGHYQTRRWTWPSCGWRGCSGGGWVYSNHHGEHVQNGGNRYNEATSQPHRLQWGYKSIVAGETCQLPL